MMNESELPGVGVKYWRELENGRIITIIKHESGRFEIAFSSKESEIPEYYSEMTEEEAIDIGSILTQKVHQKIVEKMDILVKNLIIEWFKIPSTFKSRTIGEIQIRKKTGASVVAILREKETIPSPGPNDNISPQDVLLVVGKKESIESFKKLFND
ncbi:MAG: potassium transporter TrkA [Deltaproteobacteria bacterium]|nr:potassium transporter TrkA [Deltaproteobacteria bacterium]